MGALSTLQPWKKRKGLSLQNISNDLEGVTFPSAEHVACKGL